MVILKQKRKAWKAKHIKACGPDGQKWWLGWVVRGWKACDNTAAYGNAWGDKYPYKEAIDCAHCRTCGMRIEVGVTYYTKSYLCPENKDSYGDWRWEPYDTPRE